MKKMTVRELYDRIQALADHDFCHDPTFWDREVVIRIIDDEGSIGNLVDVDYDHGCNDTPLLVLDGTAESMDKDSK